MSATVIACLTLSMLFGLFTALCERERRKRANHPVVIRVYAHPWHRPYLSDADDLVWGGYCAVMLCGRLMIAAALISFFVAVGILAI